MMIREESELIHQSEPDLDLPFFGWRDRKSTRLNSSHTVIYTLSLHDALPISLGPGLITGASDDDPGGIGTYSSVGARFGFAILWMARSEEHTSELQSHSDLHSFPTRRSSDLSGSGTYNRRFR